MSDIDDDIDAEIQRLARKVWTPDRERLNRASRAWGVVEREMRERHTNLETVRRRVPDVWSSTAAKAYQRRMKDISLTLDNVANAASSWQEAMDDMYQALRHAQLSMNTVVREYWAKKKQENSLLVKLVRGLENLWTSEGPQGPNQVFALPLPRRSSPLQPYLDRASRIVSDLREAVRKASAKTTKVGPFQGAGPVVLDMSFLKDLLAAGVPAPVPAPNAPAPPAPPAGGAVPPVPTPAGQYLTVAATTTLDQPASAAVPAPPGTAGAPIAVPPPGAGLSGAPIGVPAPGAGLSGAPIGVPAPGAGLTGAPVGVPAPGEAGAIRGSARSSLLGRAAPAVPLAPLPPGPTMPLGLRPPVSDQRGRNQPGLGIPANPSTVSPRLGAQRPVAPQEAPPSRSASRQRDEDRERRGGPGTPAAALPTVPSLTGRKVVRIGGTDRTGAASAPPPVARRRAGRPEQAPRAPVDETPLPAVSLVGRRAQRLTRRAGGHGAGTIRVVPTRIAPGWAATRVARREAVRPVLTGRPEGTDGFTTSAVVADRYMRLVEATRARRRTRDRPADRATTTGPQDAFQRRAAAPIALDTPAEVTVETTPALRPPSAP